ncbi:MAG: diaminopimelate epimerase [Pseudomonadota bacterium]|nr:diaminopimelate epimerase [Burkholderiaceae bacterium]MDQ3444648.1 diaminopimelate epimerase [Pseudomonadota bacterium]
MKLRFTKMHGTGNDFVMLNGVTQRIELSPEQLRLLADRRFGVGSDQILLVEKASQPDVDFRYRIFNGDGGEAEQCGNGARCFVKFVHDEGLTSKPAIRVQTLAGIIEPRLLASGEVSVDMGTPRFDSEDAGFDSTGLTPMVEHRQALWPLDVGHGVMIAVLSMGNPHAVQTVRDVETASVTTDGPLIERHHRFRDRVNAGFMQILDRHCIRLRVWERGAGETLACGTGACAAVVSGIRRGLLDTPVTVVARGGELRVEWTGGGEAVQPVLMTGAATTVFKGEIEI